MRGLKNIVKKSKDIDPHSWHTWLSIYYDFDTKAVSTKDTGNNYFVTKIIRPCTEGEILETIERWKRT